MLTKLYSNRPLVYVGLAIVGCLFLIDSVPKYTLLHGRMKQWVDPVLDVTGLWQGSWELYAPSPDHVNVRVGAKVVWKGRKPTTWEQPNWHAMSAWDKSLNFRKMSYFDGLWNSSNSPAWPAFCKHLACELELEHDQTPHSIFLYQERDVIPPPSKKFRSAYSAPQYGSPQRLFIWQAND